MLTTAAVTSYGLFAAGWILYGIFTLRAGVIPAPISIALIAGGAAGFLALSAPFGIPLGLAMVAQAVSRHGGSLEVADSPLGGARFVVDVRLPARTGGGA